MKESRAVVAVPPVPGLVLVAVALGLWACRGQNPGAPDPSWIRVAERTSCEALNPSYCAGTYGFTVTSDGRYVVGPAENGVQVGGSLSEAELARLSADAARVAGGLGGGQQCDTAGTVPGVGDTVDLTDSRDGTSRVFDLEVKGTCTRGGRDQAVQLHDDLNALMLEYYPRPFPP
ncbi:MAG TPA: hypothetical protein VMT70_14870 [Vicinamibacteria bacterium]|nr:hypothetical protein [Vicinamibacteria bacterium]